MEFLGSRKIGNYFEDVTDYQLPTKGLSSKGLITYIMMQLNLLRGGKVVKALWYKLEGRGFETR
jgi:hypothetical protein